MCGQKTAELLIIVVLATIVSAEHNAEDDGLKSCSDDSANEIAHGEVFVPKSSDPCTTCTCDNGYAIMCHTSVCRPPVGCVRTDQVPHECCKYHCLDADGNSMSPSANDSTSLGGKPDDDVDNITNLSLRLVASTVTSFLVLALLLFMVHRLRQRRLMMAMRRFEAQARHGQGEDDLDHYIPAEFMQIECPPYEDPPPPYSPPKPPHILPEDAPPPYEEVENTGSQLDTNANINNNNNNNQTCENLSRAAPAGEGQITAADSQDGNNSSPRVADIIESLNSGSGMLHGSAASQQRYTEGSLFSGIDQTFLKSLIDGVGETCRPVPEQLQANRIPEGSRRTSDACDQTLIKALSREPAVEFDAGLCDRTDAFAAVRELQGQVADPDSRSRRARQPGRSCSFSYTRSPEQDEISAVALGPMSHSYHAATADSGVQTLGSYTASLSRRKARASPRDAPQLRQTISEAGEAPSNQRMIRKPMIGGDSTVQQSHRRMQEELLRSLPPMQGGDCEVGSSAGGIQPPPAAPIGVGGVPSDSRGNISPRPEPDGDDFSSPDHCANVSSTMPRSQSVTSTFSVCSETGEVRLKKTLSEMDGSVLQSDSPYPEFCRPSLHHTQTSDPLIDLPQSACRHQRQCSTEAETTISRGVPLASGPSDFGCGPQRCEMPLASSLPLTGHRTLAKSPRLDAHAALGTRSHTPKQKQGKKIHFVPLEKSKTFKSGKKEKGKGAKKGTSVESQCDTNTAQVSGSTSSAASDTFPAQDAVHPGAESRMLQPKSVDPKRGRPGAQSSVKQYGFLDNFVSPCPQELSQEDGFDPNCRPPEYGFDPTTVRTGFHPYRSLPHQPHDHVSRAMQLAGHRRQLSHPEKSARPNSATLLQPRLKPRPQSGGPTVEPGCNPLDPAAALPQNSIPRRRVKAAHAKKSRQSCPALDAGPGAADKRAVNGIDLGLVEPGLEHVRNAPANQDGAPFNLKSKRRSADRSSERGGHNLFANGYFVESQMSSYV